jgi:fatty-acyl-CoA synthase
MPLTLSHAAGPTEPPLRDITLGQLLAWAAETTPDRLALIAGVPDPAARRQWTYAELYQQAQRTAKALRAHFEPGERVAVWAPNLPEWVMLEFGCALAGVVLVTVNPAFRAQELEYVLKQSRSAGIFVVESFRGNPMLATVQQVAPNCPELRDVIRFDAWDAFLARGDAPVLSLPEVKIHRSGDDPVHLGHHRLSRRARCCTTAGWSTTVRTRRTAWACRTARCG